MKFLLLAFAALIGNLRVENADTEEEAPSSDEARASDYLPAPWPMACNFIVHVVDDQSPFPVVVAKRDCKD